MVRELNLALDQRPKFGVAQQQGELLSRRSSHCIVRVKAPMTFRRKSPFDIFGSTIRGETIALGDPSKVTVLRKINFQQCRISINCSARGLVVDRCTFQDCHIGAKKEQSDHQFFTSTFEGCTFTGDYYGCEFGFRTALQGRTRGTIAQCDFTEARLDLVSFNNCDLSTIKLPRWPHFTITNPSATAMQIPNPLDCEEMEILISTCLGQKPITKGIICYAPFFLQEETEYNEGQLRQLLSGVPGILL